MKRIFISVQMLAIVALLQPLGLYAQKKPAVTTDKKIVFAVVNEGKWVEPIGFIEKGELAEPTGGDSDKEAIKLFNSIYYRKGAVYDLIFGGAKAGTVSVVKSDHTSECSANMAEATVASTRAKIAGRVMGLATNFKPTKAGSGVRRLPTPAERVEADNLVKAEFAKQGNSAEIIATRDYHNLTALDVDGDGKIELVGSFWVKPGEKTRNTLFFIADKAANGKYQIGFGKYNIIKEESVMGGDITAIDGGIYHELLLDVLDINNDGVSEIFTYSQSFEGAGFNAYRRVGGKWDSAYEVSNYHCAF
jgi:hypothetical protein